ncbi:hypothetical protein D3C71_1585080 [compost metagenome]
MQVAHGGIEHLEAVTAAGAAVVLDQGLHQLLIGGQVAVGHLDGDDVPWGAFLPFMKFTPADAQALKDALETGHLSRVLSVDEGVLHPLTEQVKRLPLEAGDVPLPSDQRQHGLRAGHRVLLGQRLQQPAAQTAPEGHDAFGQECRLLHSLGNGLAVFPPGGRAVWQLRGLVLVVELGGLSHGGTPPAHSGAGWRCQRRYPAQ